MTKKSALPLNKRKRDESPPAKILRWNDDYQGPSGWTSVNASNQNSLTVAPTPAIVRAASPLASTSTSTRKRLRYVLPTTALAPSPTVSSPASASTSTRNRLRCILPATALPPSPTALGPAPAPAPASASAPAPAPAPTPIRERSLNRTQSKHSVPLLIEPVSNHQYTKQGKQCLPTSTRRQQNTDEEVKQILMKNAKYLLIYKAHEVTPDKFSKYLDSNEVETTKLLETFKSFPAQLNDIIKPEEIRPHLSKSDTWTYDINKTLTDEISVAKDSTTWDQMTRTNIEAADREEHWWEAVMCLMKTQSEPYSNNTAPLSPGEVCGIVAERNQGRPWVAISKRFRRSITSCYSLHQQLWTYAKSHVGWDAACIATRGETQLRARTTREGCNYIQKIVP